MSNPEARRRAVLQAIVRDYVTHREPVASKTLVERHNLGVSSATIRNDMMLLEEAGLIVQPHTSAGRVPTNAGYRVFVDSLAEIKPLSRAEQNAFRKVLTQAVDLDDVLIRAGKLLAQVTHQVALVQYPSLKQTRLRHVELVLASRRILLIILITDSGRVEQRTLELNAPLDDLSLEQLRLLVNQIFAGLGVVQLRAVHLADYKAKLESIAGANTLVVQNLLEQILAVAINALEADTEERVIVAGTGNLSRYDVDFSRTISPILDALEEQVVLLKLFAHHQSGVQVHIGQENQADAFQETSLISSGYGSVEGAGARLQLQSEVLGADKADESGDNVSLGETESPLTNLGITGGEQAVASIGIIGPTRMDYAAAMSSVYAISQYLTEILNNG